MGIMSFVVTGDFDNTDRFLDFVTKKRVYGQLDTYGRAGVEALAAATPIGPTGVASASWDYEVVEGRGTWSIFWTNSDTEDGFSVVIGLQYGHGTGTGGWVQGQDFINPAIAPIMDRIAEDAWKAVTSA